MKKAVMYGAGNIGRGFLGELFSKSGYEVVFIDVNAAVVEALNREGQYPVTYVTSEEEHDVMVSNVRAINGTDVAAAAEEIADCDIMATAVGVNVLKRIAAPIAKGIALRKLRPKAAPLNILICENLIDANRVLRDMIAAELKDDEYLEAAVGFVEASVSRMVPVMTPEMQRGNSLRVCVEPYSVLPVDKDGFRGEIPKIHNMKACGNFDFYIRRKLYVHNMGHAAAAYLGALQGGEYIWQAMGLTPVRQLVSKAMTQSARALSSAYGVSLEEVQSFADDLLLRFENRALGDTVARVGRDLDRKLSARDRMAGAIALCRQQGESHCAISVGLSAALCFNDSQPGRTAELLSKNQPEKVLREMCGLPDEIIEEIMCMYRLAECAGSYPLLRK